MHKDILALAPSDVQIEVLSYLEDYRSLIKWARVSKRWREFIGSPSLEPVYKRLVRENWLSEYNQINRRRACSTDPQAPRFCEILIILGKNLAEIKLGHLYEAGSIINPPHLGRVDFCYANGYLAVFSTAKRKTAENDTIYVYDLSVVANSGNEVSVRKIKCEGKVEHVSIAGGYMAWMTQDENERTNISLGLVDLITFSARSFSPTVLDLDSKNYVSILNGNGPDSFTNTKKGRSTYILRLAGSPELFRTNGRHVVFSSSFLTYYTVWEINIDTQTPIIGSSYSLDPEWNDFLYEMWTENLAWNKPSSLKCYLSIDDECGIYTVINGFLEEKGCLNYYDRFLVRYACRIGGKPYRMKDTAGVPPYRNPELSDSHACFVAAQLASFPSGGQNLFYYHPANTRREEEYSQTPRDTLLDGDYRRISRIVVDRKQSRHDEEWEHHYKADFSLGSKPATEYEYNIQHLNPFARYRLPKSERVSLTRVIPDLSPGCVAWQFQYHDEQVLADGEEGLKIRKLRIVGVKPQFQSKKKIFIDIEDDRSIDGKDSDNGGGNENQVEGERRDAENDSNGEKQMKSIFCKEDIPEPASICELVLDYKFNQKIKWDGDDQYIVLRNYRSISVPPGDEAPVPNFTGLFTLFRYGNGPGAPISYNIRQSEESPRYSRS